MYIYIYHNDIHLSRVFQLSTSSWIWVGSMPIPLASSTFLLLKFDHVNFWWIAILKVRPCFRLRGLLASWLLGFFVDVWSWINIPIRTIFSGMSIHKSQLFWCEQTWGTRFWPIHISSHFGHKPIRLQVDPKINPHERQKFKRYTPTESFMSQVTQGFFLPQWNKVRVSPVSNELAIINQRRNPIKWVGNASHMFPGETTTYQRWLNPPKNVGYVMSSKYPTTSHEKSHEKSHRIPLDLH